MAARPRWQCSAAAPSTSSVGRAISPPWRLSGCRKRPHGAYVAIGKMRQKTPWETEGLAAVLLTLTAVVNGIIPLIATSAPLPRSEPAQATRSSAALSASLRGQAGRDQQDRNQVTRLGLSARLISARAFRDRIAETFRSPTVKFGPIRYGVSANRSFSIARAGSRTDRHLAISSGVHIGICFKK